MGVGVNGNLIPPKPGEIRNPKGMRKGTIHLSTHIQNMLNDPQFSPAEVDGKIFEGTPIKAIMLTALKKAREGDNKWADWLAKYGYGQKFELEHSGEIANGVSDPALAAEFSAFLKDRTKQ